MKDYIFNLLSSQNELTWKQILVQILVSAIIGVVIYISYYISHRGTIFSKKFNVTLMALTILTATVMTVIGNNIALSLGMVGALSIVRFRTAIKDSRDTAYIFWAIIVGICCGVGDYTVAAIGSATVFIVLLIFGCIKSDTRMLLSIKGDATKELQIESTVYTYFNHKANLRVKNVNDKTVEFIYEISKTQLEKSSRGKKSISETLFEIENMNYVNIIAQSDEISA